MISTKYTVRESAKRWKHLPLQMLLIETQRTFFCGSHSKGAASVRTGKADDLYWLLVI